MQTLTLRPVANGYWQGWDSFTGAVQGAWDAVDDVVADSDTTYITLSTQAPPNKGRASFLWGGYSNLKPVALRVMVRHKKQSGTTDPQMEAGLWRTAGQSAAVGSSFTCGATYVTHTDTFAVNPFNGAPWAAGDLNGCEVLVRMVDDPHAWISRVTQVVLELDYEEPFNVHRLHDYGDVVA